VVDQQQGLFGHGHVHLQAGAGNRDILQVRQGGMASPGLVRPVDIQQICAEQPRFSAPFLHAISIGGRREKFSRAAANYLLTHTLTVFPPYSS